MEMTPVIGPEGMKPSKLVEYQPQNTKNCGAFRVRVHLQVQVVWRSHIRMHFANAPSRRASRSALCRREQRAEEQRSRADVESWEGWKRPRDQGRDQVQVQKPASIQFQSLSSTGRLGFDQSFPKSLA